MATTKKTDEVKEEVKETKEKTVKIRLPKDRYDNAPVFVGVNGRTFMIKRGEDAEVPECVAHVLELSEKAEDEIYAYEEYIKEQKKKAHAGEQ